MRHLFLTRGPVYFLPERNWKQDKNKERNGLKLTLNYQQSFLVMNAGLHWMDMTVRLEVFFFMEMVKEYGLEDNLERNGISFWANIEENITIAPFKAGWGIKIDTENYLSSWTRLFCMVPVISNNLKLKSRFIQDNILRYSAKWTITLIKRYKIMKWLPIQ